MIDYYEGYTIEDEKQAYDPENKMTMNEFIEWYPYRAGNTPNDD
jgi:hypothetical protein